MRIKDNIAINVNVRIEKIDVKTGKIRDVVEVHNLVTDVGLNEIRNFLSGTATDFDNFAIGTGTTAAASDDTALETEVFRDTITQRSNIDTGEMQFKYYLSSDDANGNAISEAGILDASSGGDLLARVVFAADDKTASEAWNFVWTFTIGRA
jgi:hypothetical protein